LVKYSARSARALGFLKSYYNDVEIFVEDTGNHNMWLRLLRALLPKRTRLSSVNLLGGRESVLEACRRDQVADKRRKLYIIDADFDYAHKIRKPRLKYLYRLRAYCVENILISPEALLEIAEECAPSLTPAQLNKRLDLPALFRDFDGLLRPLFSLYAVVNFADPSIQTVGFGIGKLLTNAPGGPFLDANKIRARMLSLARAAIDSVGLTAFQNVHRSLRTNLRKLSTDKLVSGKDGIHPVVVIWMKSRVGYRDNEDHLKVKLAQGFEPRSEPWLASVLRSL
jgi:hypothetical protein